MGRVFTERGTGRLGGGAPDSRDAPAAPRAVVVDPDPLGRRALTLLLKESAVVSVHASFGADVTAEELAAAAPDLVLLDADLQGTAGRRLLDAVVAAVPRARTLIVTTVADPRALHHALLHGASGYLLKRTAVADLPAAVEQVLAGRVPIARDVSDAMRERLSRPAARPLPPLVDVPLTARELTVLRLVASGLTNEQIAADLVLSPGTVKLHVQRIIAKLGVANRTQAAVYAARKGLLGDDA